MQFLQQYLPNLIASVIILVLGFPFSKFFSKALVKILRRSKLDEGIVEFVSSFLNAVTLFIVVVLAISKLLNTDLSSLVATLGAIFVAFSIVLKDSLSSALSGMVIVGNKLFTIGDVVEFDGVTGEVVRISLLTTKILVAHGKEITVPNSKLVSENVLSYSKEKAMNFEIDMAVKDARQLKRFEDYFSKVFLDKGFVELTGSTSASVNFKVHILCSYKDFGVEKKKLSDCLKKSLQTATRESDKKVETD